MSVLRFLTLSLLLLGIQCGMAQEKLGLLGSVKDIEDNPIAGANVYIDGVNTYEKTNARGYFQVEVDPESRVISVYAEEYGLMSAIYDKQPRLKFVFIEKNLQDKKAVEELLAQNSIGYGSVEKADAVYATSKIDTEETGPVSNAAFTIYDLISTRVPGVQVTSNNRIIVRGVNSFRGTDSPLIVVNDQIVSSVDFLQPSDVKSIEFLKDAAASIYGSQGANGVLIIKLKE